MVQYDPPSDPKVFHHRCGRTARAGRSGRAIVMLHAGREEGYVEFLQIKQVLLGSYPYIESDGHAGTEPEHDARAHELFAALRATVREDRALYELGLRAFVSWAKAYSKHEVAFIFRLTDLPLDGMACQFVLLHLPRMPELRTWQRQGTLFTDDVPDLPTFAYADKQREKQRQASLARRAAEPAAPPRATPRAKSEAWSEQKRRKATRQVRREKKQRKRQWLANQAASQPEPDEEGEDDDDDDFDAEERAAKKLKKGTLSQEAFDHAFFDSL